VLHVCGREVTHWLLEVCLDVVAESYTIFLVHTDQI